MEPIVFPIDPLVAAALLEEIFHSTRGIRLLSWMAIRCWMHGERVAGFDTDGVYTPGLHLTWPRRARAWYWLGSRLDDLKIWSLRRRAKRRMKK